jgi:hypothetical protein
MPVAPLPQYQRKQEKVVVKQDNEMRDMVWDSTQNKHVKINDIGIEFNHHLARAYDRGAYNSGVQGCMMIITQYAESEKALEISTVLLRALTEKSST